MPETTIKHEIQMPPDTAAFFYDKWVDYKEATEEDLSFSEYLGTTVLSSLQALMEGRVPFQKGEDA